MDMTTRGGGGRSLTIEIRSHFCTMASTLHQLIGWLLNSRGDGESKCMKPLQHVELFEWYWWEDHMTHYIRGVLTSSQQGPRIFRLSSKCSKLEVFVPKTWENVEPFRSDGNGGSSACSNIPHLIKNKLYLTNVPLKSIWHCLHVRYVYSRSIWLQGTRSVREYLAFQRHSSWSLAV